MPLAPGGGIDGRDDGFGAERAGKGGDLRRGFGFAGELAEKIGLELGRDRLVDELVRGGGGLVIGQMDRLGELIIK